jgi:hypothetical protein
MTLTLISTVFVIAPWVEETVIVPVPLVVPAEKLTGFPVAETDPIVAIQLYVVANRIIISVITPEPDKLTVAFTPTLILDCARYYVITVSCYNIKGYCYFP